MRMPPNPLLVPFLLVLAGALAACDESTNGEATGESCADLQVLADCQPQYIAYGFDDFHERTLVPQCALAGGSCHAMEGAQGGLVLETADEAFAGLVDDGRVQAYAPGCSVAMDRVMTGSMPPGKSMTEAEQCVMWKWIEAGAPR